MKFVRFLNNYHPNRVWNILILGNPDWEYLREQAKTPLPENQYYAACLECAYDDKPILASLIGTTTDLSEKRVYVTKDCSERLVGSHTTWNCIVELDSPYDKVFVIGEEK